MAALDFPPSPVVGDKYPVTPVPGQPQYTWDGEKWTTTGAQVTSASPSNNLPLMDATPAVPGVGTQYSREDHVHPTDTSRAADTAVLKKVPQSLTVTEQTDVRKNLYAAPLDALAYSGMQINGSMEVSQALGTSGVGLAGPTHILDGFKGFLAGTGAFGAQQQTVVPPGFVKSLFLNCTTANPLGGANDGQWLQTDIEGYRWSRLAWGTANAQPVTISFWVRTPIAGTMAVAVQDLASPYRTYVVDVAVTAANTWEYKTVTIPGDTGGIWNKDNLTGASVIFCFGVGSGRKTTANVWATQGTAVGTTATTNFFAAVGGAYLTGVVVLPGVESPTAARSPLIMRPFDQELITCQRYWYCTNGLTPKGSSIGAAQMMAFNPAYLAGSVKWAVQMRVVPTVTIWNSGTQNQIRNATSGSVIAITPTTINAYVNGASGVTISPSSLTSGNAYDFDYQADARL